MRVVLNKLKDVSRVTVRGVKLSRKGESISMTERNSITSASTVKVLWIMFLLVLSHGTPTVFDNRRDRKF